MDIFHKLSVLQEAVVAQDQMSSNLHLPELSNADASQRAVASNRPFTVTLSEAALNTVPVELTYTQTSYFSKWCMLRTNCFSPPSQCFTRLCADLHHEDGLLTISLQYLCTSTIQAFSAMKPILALEENNDSLSE